MATRPSPAYVYNYSSPRPSTHCHSSFDMDGSPGVSKERPYADARPDLPHHQNSSMGRRTNVHPAGESGRRGFNPIKFFVICFHSSCTMSKVSTRQNQRARQALTKGQFMNVLWPVVPFAFAFHWTKKEAQLLNFVLSYIAMVPSANLLGFAAQELASKMPRVLGVVMETTFGSIVEFILLLVLLKRGDAYVPVIKAAILGSILANMLLCLGLCFFFGGLRREQQEFHEAISEVRVEYLS